MKKLLLLLLFSFTGFAQVGINTTTPNASSMLDVTATDKGVLIPRISIPDLNASGPVTSPATSLLVYNTNATTGIGFYYWDGSKWTPLGSGTNYWTKTGNDIYNNNSGNVGVGTTAPTNKFHIENVGTAGSLLNQDFESNAIAPLTAGGSANWATQTAQKFAGTYAAKSGTIGHNQTSFMTHTVTVPAGGGTLSFYYRVSSESGYDYLKFYIDGVQQNQWSGTVGWTQQTYLLAAGSRTLRWEYSKDVSTSTAEDAGYIDNISIATSAPAAIRIVDGNQGLGKALVSDANGNATWQQLTASNVSIPDLVTIQDLDIPICSSNAVGSTGSITRSIKGVSTTITWTILARQTTASSTAVISGSTVLLAPAKPEKLQVRYDFSPQLPFSPTGIMFAPYNNSSYPDTFNINYSQKSQSSMTVNITRTDVLGDTSATCWMGQFYFDAIIIN
ncbi:hypothetical protein ABGT15_12895 [Flavobacterium enshiense]|uniref:hypothetical protein n=1 Tax=Flavobacterium enshiense TaxID=1341165 RepID=UPI00345D83E7